VQEALRHWRKSISEPITIAIILLAAVLSMISGPFGTLQAFSPAFRLLYWLPIIGVGGGVSLFIRIVLRLWKPEVAKGWIELATVVVFTAVFGVPLVLWSAYFVDVTDAHNALPPMGPQLLYLALVCGSFLWLRTFVINVVSDKATEQFEDDNRPAVHDETGPSLTPRLLKRLPVNEPVEVVFLMADDHFVDVHTTAGTHRLRMRFKDAINEMEGVEGFCAHRSYWFNRAAVVEAIRINNAWRLRLVNGEEIPVSRKFQPNLEAAGVLHE
jgi:hypothetical protein